MPVLSVRPKVAELSFQVFGRSLHPELFDACKSQEFHREQYMAKVTITTAGHVVTWSHQGIVLTEVAASAHHPTPQRRRLVGCRLKERQQDEVEYRGGVRYRYGFELDQVQPDVFFQIQQELSRQSSGNELMVNFDSSGRIAIGAVSFIHVETRLRSMTVKAFHTFPDDYAVVRTQSTFWAE